MTEAEWLACADPQKLLAFLRGRASDRKLRLFACACYRMRGGFGGDRARGAAEVAERYADGLATPGELEAARRDAGANFAQAEVSYQGALASFGAYYDAADEYAAAGAALASTAPAVGNAAGLSGEAAYDFRGDYDALLLRDVFGNPFRPPPAIDPAWLAWNGGTVRKLAEAIYDDRSFDRLPVQADALEDAGCADAELLGHLRGPGPHVRGCWALDLILGKE
jgi:hypothetical protein